jgi:hypothetical protein
MHLRQPIQNLFLATWETDAEQVKAHLPDGFEPITAGGRALISAACFRNKLARLGALPVPPYGEIDLRTFVVDRRSTAAVFVFDFFVPPVGLAASPFGVPVHVTRISVVRGRISAPGIGVSARYTVGDRAELGDREAALSPHASAYWLKGNRLRQMLGGYHGVTWRQAELTGEPQFDPAARLGIDRRPDFALYSERAELSAHLPARRTET